MSNISCASLTANRLLCQRSDVYPVVRHASGVPKKPTKPPREPETDLQKLFLARVHEEMGKQGISGNALCLRRNQQGMKLGPRQSTFSDAMRSGNPKLETIAKIADALDVPAWTLLVPSELAATHTPERRKVFQFPSYPSVLTTNGQRKRHRRTG